MMNLEVFFNNVLAVVHIALLRIPLKGKKDTKEAQSHSLIKCPIGIIDAIHIIYHNVIIHKIIFSKHYFTVLTSVTGAQDGNKDPGAVKCTAVTLISLL